MQQAKQDTPDIFSTAGEVVEEVEKEAPGKRFNVDRSIEDLVGSICDPIIVHRCAWGTRDMIPEWLRSQITLDRMIELMVARNEGRDPIGTNSEALAYLIPASLEAPMDRDWAQIYLHVATVVMDGQKNKVVPDDIRVDMLDRNQEDDLRGLKHWIYEKRRQHRTEKATDIRKERLAEEKERKAANAPELAQHTFDLGLDA